MKLFEKLDPGLRGVMKRVAVITAAAVLVMWIVFAVLHMMKPDQVPFDYTVILAGIIGCAIALWNFYQLVLAVQKISYMEDENSGKSAIQRSYAKRMLLMAAWFVLAFFAPCFQWAAGVIPLVIPMIAYRITAQFL